MQAKFDVIINYHDMDKLLLWESLRNALFSWHREGSDKVRTVAINLQGGNTPALCPETRGAPKPGEANLSAGAALCPHYFEATDGVHAVLVGQCRCKGKL